MRCGKRPTVYDTSFIDFGGAYPGFIILNPRKMRGLPRVVKLYVFAHECGHQYVGANERAADCYAIKRGRKEGWLSSRGLNQVCRFIRPYLGDGAHPPGPERCRIMRRCYREAGNRSYKQARRERPRR